MAARGRTRSHGASRGSRRPQRPARRPPEPGSSEGANSTGGMRWEWQDQGGSWHLYPPPLDMDISQAFRAGDILVNISPDGGDTKLQVDLKRMVQRNVQTGVEQRVAAAVGGPGSYYVWQWQEEEEWIPYPPETCLALEAAREGGGGSKPKVDLAVGRTRYSLDPDNMLQTNRRSGFQRQMERRPSVAVELNGAGGSCEISSDGPPVVKRARGCQQPRTPVDASGRKQEAGSEADAKGDAREGESNEAVKTLLLKGKAPVDPECTAKLGRAHVYCEGDDVYDVMLSQTNLQFNNNKYYLIQLLEDDSQKIFSVWMRWGRVGKSGQRCLMACAGDLSKAKEIFHKKFLDKTKNHWEDRSCFQKVAGKYDLLQTDYTSQSQGLEELPTPTPRPLPESQLDPRVQALLRLICNVQAMEEMVVEMKYDTKKAPLGKLTVAQIRAGYESLKKIEACIQARMGGRALVEACNEFYTKIPHDFGLRPPPLIRTEAELSAKVQLLEALGDIEIAIKLVKSEQDSLEHPLDQHYRNLHCALRPLDHSCHEFKVISQYLQSTHAPTHNDYTMTLLEVFEVEKEGETMAFREELSNRMLLWHGSRLGNWAGILSQGLRIAPPEAPITGYMFGKGIYFADMSPRVPTTASPPASMTQDCCCWQRWPWGSGMSCWKPTLRPRGCCRGGTAPRGSAGRPPSPAAASL
ncbi:LOW QUALITY PROTEIN: poly [ADP-ribose] polymerase 2 [Tachyglossus aculeatus]|uniref:LOW QUALITY PROTEIN: poly [ADP-ribose] polymerase 2 n=1 Tax=Tachyglossus aculeatus TaxID=9261 RepID=UPI0018F3BE7A|nr:LOW QUALITY PROTEIN: poly [ADP-ribose] polymerase 2 [Tachyglossus aculeatus]